MASRAWLFFILLILISISTSESRLAPGVLSHPKRELEETLMEKALKILELSSKSLGERRNLYDVNRLAPAGPDPRHHY